MKHCYIYICIGLLSFLVGCISAFEPKDVKDTAGILVVEGMILESTSTQIKLSRTQKLSSTDAFEKVNSATVRILSDDGSIVAVADFLGDGIYQVQENLTFVSGLKYAVDIDINGKHYQSAFVTPLRTPEIEDVSWTVAEDGKEVDIYVSTSSTDENLKYFRWKYDEDWEIRSNLLAELRWNPETNAVESLNPRGPKNTYYCWNRAKSTTLMLGNTAKLTENKIKDKRILNLKAGGSRFSYLYSILVRQYSVPVDAYNYFENLQSNIENTGSLFAPQPTEMVGNITCLSDPEEPVIGFICAGSETTYRIFIDATEVPKMKEFIDCTDERDFSHPQEAYLQGYGIMYFNEVTYVYVGATLRCLDCTLRGDKEKPDFWPNDHQ